MHIICIACTVVPLVPCVRQVCDTFLVWHSPSSTLHSFNLASSKWSWPIILFESIRYINRSFVPPFHNEWWSYPHVHCTSRWCWAFQVHHMSRHSFASKNNSRGFQQMHRCFMVFYQWFHFKRQPQTTKRWPARRCNSGLISWSIQWQSLQKKTVNYLIKHPVLFCALHHFNDAPCFGSILTYHEMIWNGLVCRPWPTEWTGKHLSWR